jgi:putative ABC transport system ATP-binding protein
MSMPTPNGPPSATLDGVTKHHPGGVTALRNVSVQFAAGEQVAIVGPSGSGKTTLLTILGTLERASAGTVNIAGLDIDRCRDRTLAGLRAHHIGFVFQSFHLQDTLSAVDNVATGMLYDGTRLRLRRLLARETLEQVGLGHRLNHRPGAMSGGERQRVAIARALAKSPTLILADEPTGNLDSRSGTEVLEILHRLGETGSTLVLITHDRAVAETFPRRLHLRDGEIVKDES